jgi:hypothetical protein
MEMSSLKKFEALLIVNLKKVYKNQRKPNNKKTFKSGKKLRKKSLPIKMVSF